MHKSPETTEPGSESRGSSHARTRSPGSIFSTRLRRWGAATGIVLLLALVLSTGVRIFAVDLYTISQDSMAPTVADGERVLVDKRYPGASGVQPGDIVVFDGEGSFAPYRGGPSLQRTAERLGHWFGLGSPTEVFVKRVIGAGGDRVVCCDDEGRLTLNGAPLQEEYLAEPVSPEQPASELEFEAEVPPGRMWVMGDHREGSVDSRDLLGAPGGGMISEDRIIGRATDVVWPWPHRRSLEGDRP